MKPPTRGQHYFIRSAHDRGGIKRFVVLAVSKKYVRVQHLMNDGSVIVNPVPMPPNRNPACMFIRTISRKEWDRVRKYWQLKRPPWVERLEETK